MTGKTHMSISAATIAALLAVTRLETYVARATMSAVDVQQSLQREVPELITLLLLGVVAGLFPDLDAPDTELQHMPQNIAAHIGRFLGAGLRKSSLVTAVLNGIVHLAVLPFTLLISGISAVLRTFTVHRGFTHTLWGALLFTCITSSLAFLVTNSSQWSFAAGIVWLLGYMSHLAADACTPSGIPLFGSMSFPQALLIRLLSRARGAPLSRAVSSKTRQPHYASKVHAFHLLPRRMLIRTGSRTDTLVIRWLSWIVFATAMLIRLTA